MAKRPLLTLLENRYPHKTRKELYAAVLCGDVHVQGGFCKNPKEIFPDDALISLHDGSKYVSRGGEKLAPVLDLWQIPVAGNSWIDAGASTGGFTDALLQYGAERVFSVDVGYNQLDYRLRQDPRVVVMERTNAMHLEPLNPQPYGVVGDLSFRSLSGIASHLLSLTSGKIGVFLLKPQFEVDKTPDFDGVVRDMGELESICIRTVHNLRSEGVYTYNIEPSSIRGRRGNQEFLLYLGTQHDEQPIESMVFSCISKIPVT